MQAWTDLSLRTKLLVFALGLVIVPGAVFALVTFSGARTRSGLRWSPITEQVFPRIR